MASETLSMPRAAGQQWIDEAIVLAFLLLAFVGVQPFHPPPPELLGGVEKTGAGDSLRQVLYLLAFSAIAWRSFSRSGVQAVSAISLSLLVLLAWCVASALWSPEPAVSIRRSGLAVVLVVSAMLSIDTIGARRTLSLLRWVLLAILVVNVVSIRFIPAAVHLPGETDPALVGNWRGMYGHKNIAGAVGAITALLFLFSPSPTRWRKLFDIAVVALAVFFTVMTHSKTSLGLLAVAAVAGLTYRIAWRRDIDRLIAAVLLLFLLTGLATLLIADQTVITRQLEDPTQFTGRTEIWRAELAYVRDHPLLGAGYGTFSDTGKESPLYRYIGGWVTTASHGHNGYLQLMVTTGGIGFALGLIALIVVPLIQFWRRGDVALKATLFSIFVFLALHNLMETDFMEGDGVAWGIYLVMMAMLGKIDREAAA
jgi:exopolysaccharide production protein ExoQ